MKRRESAKYILRRNIELAAVASIVGTLGAWRAIELSLPQVPTSTRATITGLMCLGMLGVYAWMWRRPSPWLVERLAARMPPRSKRRMLLSRFSILVLGVVGSAAMYFIVGVRYSHGTRESAVASSSASIALPEQPMETATDLRPLSRPISIGFGWRPGMRLRFRQDLVEEEKQPNRAVEFKASLEFDIVVSADGDGLRVTTDNIRTEISAGSSSNIARRHRQQIAVTRASPSFLVDSEGRFLRVVDPRGAVERMRAAMRSAPAMDDIEVLVASVDKEWVTQHAGQQWESWGHAVLSRVVADGPGEKIVSMTLGASGAAVTGVMRTTVLGERDCPNAPRCIVIKTAMTPSSDAAITEIQGVLKRTGSPMIVTAFQQERATVLEVDEQMIPRALQTSWSTETHMRHPEGHPIWSRSTIRTDARFVLVEGSNREDRPQ